MSEKKLRDVLFTPWRNSYIKKTIDKVVTPGCVFCSAVEKGVGVESLVVFKGVEASVILNKYPYNNGHTMVIPHAHVDDLSALSSSSFEELHSLLRKTYGAIKAAYNPGGLNIGMNVGRTGGAGVADHLHYHLVPRWNGDSNFMPILAGTKVVSEDLETTFNKLVVHFK